MLFILIKTKINNRQKLLESKIHIKIEGKKRTKVSFLLRQKIATDKIQMKICQASQFGSLPELWVRETEEDVTPADWDRAGGTGAEAAGTAGGGDCGGGSTCNFGSDSGLGFGAARLEAGVGVGVGVGVGFWVWVWFLALSSAKASQKALCVMKLSLLQKYKKQTSNTETGKKN